MRRSEIQYRTLADVFKHLRRSEIQDRTLADVFKHLRRSEIQDRTLADVFKHLRRSEMKPDSEKPISGEGASGEVAQSSGNTL